MWSKKQTVGGLFVKGYVGTQLCIVKTNMSTQSRTKDSEDQHLSLSSTNHSGRATQETGEVQQRMKRQMQSVRKLDQERRMARVEELRELVRTGRYHIDSMSLAQSMLGNETHFTELSQQ